MNGRTHAHLFIRSRNANHPQRDNIDDACRSRRPVPIHNRYPVDTTLLHHSRWARTSEEYR